MTGKPQPHAPWCARVPRACGLGCVSAPRTVVTDAYSESSVSVRLWSPLSRIGGGPVAVDLAIASGDLGGRLEVALSLAQAEALARHVLELVALARGEVTR